MQHYSIENQVRQLKMSRLDELLLKNQEISINVKEKLLKINKAQQNINLNINSIRPMSYGSSNTFQKSNDNSSFIQTQLKRSEHGQCQQKNIGGLNDSNQIQMTFNQIQTDRKRPLNSFGKTNEQYLSQTQKLTQYKNRKIAIRTPNLEQIKKKKEQVERIYEQLKIEERMIQQEYQSFKKNRRSPKTQNQKISQIQKQKQIIQSQISNSESRQQSLNQTHSKSFTRQSKKKSHFLSVSQQEVNQILNQPHPSKPQASSANSFIFVPFNKLYRSPILQKTSNNCLILSRMSKTANQTKDQKIINGIKYKHSNLQTDQQNLIHNTLTDKSHNHVAIVGAKDTLKKKLHMTYMAHAFNQLVQIFNSKMHNFLIFNITYQQILSSLTEPFEIQNSIQLQKQTLKLGMMQIQSTIQQIYQTILKGSNKTKVPLLQKLTLNDTSGFQKCKQNISNLKIEQKILRCTKMTLFSGKDYLWSNTIISTNRFDTQFLKCLQVQTIVWSINPLIKHYEDVSLTLNQMKAYNEMRIKNKSK